MTDDQRYKLWLGPYNTPRFRYGSVVMDEVRGFVTIVGLTNGRIPWPIGKRGRHKSYVVYRGLLKALHQEANQAVAHWWGVTSQTITKWKKALGIPVTTIGTSRLRAEHSFEGWLRHGLRAALAKSRAKRYRDSPGNAFPVRKNDMSIGDEKSLVTVQEPAGPFSFSAFDQSDCWQYLPVPLSRHFRFFLNPPSGTYTLVQ